jgi:hypothetical protein
MQFGVYRLSNTSGPKENTYEFKTTSSLGQYVIFNPSKIKLQAGEISLGVNLTLGYHFFCHNSMIKYLILPYTCTLHSRKAVFVLPRCCLADFFPVWVQHLTKIFQ